MKKALFSIIAVATLALGITAANASGGIEIPKQKWSFKSGAINAGSFDRKALRRGYQVYAEVCAGCHSLRLVAYRNLMDIGFTEDEVKAIAAEQEVQDGPDDEGEMFMRAAIPADKFVPPFANVQAARAGNNGAYPPDLSLMTKARFGGPDYLYAILIGYPEEEPEGFELGEGMSYNKYFGGHQIAMPAPLGDEGVEYADGTTATIEQQARDVTTFLTWTAAPELETRTSMGIKVLLFLLVLTAMLYALKRRIWKDLH